MKKILPLFLAIYLTVSLIGCGSSQASAQQTLESALIAVQKLDAKAIKKHFGNELFAQNKATTKFDQIRPLLVQNMKFKILDSTQNGDTATVSVEIINADMNFIMSEIYKDMLIDSFATTFLPKEYQPEQKEPDDQIVEKLTIFLNDINVKTTSSTLEIKLNRVGGKWQISSKKQLINSILGGLISFSDSLSNYIQ